VLPWCRAGGALAPSALIVGSCAPDFAYLLDTGRLNFHVWPGVLWPNLPLACAAWLLAEALVLPSLQRSAPVWRGIEWGRLAATRGLPKTWRGWVAALAAISLGIVTHLVWDGFTHALRFPARVLYPDVMLELGVARASLTWLLQAGSSVVGALLVLRAVLARYPLLPAVQPSSAVPWRWLAAMVAACIGASWLVLATRWGLERALAPFGAWLIFWYCARGLVLGLLLASAVETVAAMRRIA
jgi:hypothetical protein